MEEIEVGEYVRLKRNQGINKIIEIEDDKYILEEDIADEYGDLTCVLEKYQLKDEVEKHSKNIIDLIEVGDILQINKEKYEVVYDRSYNKLGLLIPDREKLGIRHCSLQYIFSKQGISEFKNIRVVTKEQFSNIEYRLEN